MGQLKSFDKNLFVVTSTYVLEKDQPILYVSYDFDEEEGAYWQFHCDNGDYSMEKMRLVSLETILQVDSSLKDLNLEIGMEARRKHIKDNWKKTKQ